MVRVIKSASFRKRTSIFLILMLIISCFGLSVMGLSQTAISQASVKIREVLLPAGKLIENAKREVDLQIHELSLLASFDASQNKTFSNQQRALLRLSPSIQALMSLRASPQFSTTLSQVFEPWTKSVRIYKEQISSFKSFNAATDELVVLRDKTRLLQRAVDRELSVQLLKLDESTQHHMQYWIVALLLSFIAATIFARLVWKWVSPLTELDDLLKNADSRKELPTLPSFIGSGLMTTPSEILNLSETLRTHLLNFEAQKKEHSIREERLSDSNRSMSSLFTAISYLLRYNQELIDALVKKEKLASMSEIAAQLAHEIRNPLNSMSLKLEILKEESSPEQAETIGRVIDEIDRLDALTESHLSQTRGHLKTVWPLLLNESGASNIGKILDELKVLMSESFKQDAIDFKIDIANNQSKEEIKVPKSILKSALINLIKNSQEAIRSVDDSNDSARSIGIKLVSEETKLRIFVQDTGCGFPEEFKDNPIESFRTSKSKGSGLGLITSQKMLEAYNGNLRLVKSDFPYNTTWEIEINTNVTANLSPKSSSAMMKIGDHA